MKRTVLRHILFTMLTTMLCFGFSSYVLLSQYHVTKEVSISINEEDSETTEKSITEINSFYLLNEDLLHTFPISISVQSFNHINDQVLDFNIIPSTPPPNLA